MRIGYFTAVVNKDTVYRMTVYFADKLMQQMFMTQLMKYSMPRLGGNALIHTHTTLYNYYLQFYKQNFEASITIATLGQVLLEIDIYPQCHVRKKLKLHGCEVDCSTMCVCVCIKIIISKIKYKGSRNWGEVCRENKVLVD